MRIKDFHPPKRRYPKYLLFLLIALTAGASYSFVLAATVYKSPTSSQKPVEEKNETESSTEHKKKKTSKQAENPERKKSSKSIPMEAQSKYPYHENIIATVFWVGEEADSSNAFIPNASSAWIENWSGAYGGIDNPNKRCGWKPCGVTVKENPFYFALPYNDRGENGAKPKAELQKIPWYTGKPAARSILKNRWIEIKLGKKTAYAQWEDVGPFNETDINYVFGDAPPKERKAGLDLSPAAADYLGTNGRALVKWRFVEAHAVPSGPWKEIVTASPSEY